MCRFWIRLSLIVAAVLSLALALHLVLRETPRPVGASRQQADPPPTAVVQTEGENSRMAIAPASPDSPDSPDTLSSFQTTTPYCYQPDAAQDVCYINFRQNSVASDTYVRVMTVTIESRIRAVYRGFFQSSMYAYYDMQGPGFKVACGAPNSGGVPTLGESYSYSIEFRDADDSWASNNGTLRCPPYIP